MRANLLLAALFMGCSTAYAEDAVTTEHDVGAQALEEMRGARETTPDPALSAYARCVVQRLTRTASRDRWEVVVFAEGQVALHVLPGSRLAIDTGLLRFTKNTDQLAAAIAHELGHAIANHGWDADHDAAQEEEASRIAASLVSEAGFSPAEGVAFWRRIAEDSNSPFAKLHPAAEGNASLLQASLQTEEPRYRSAVKEGAAGSCPRPDLPREQIDLYYATVPAFESLEGLEGGSL